jgi:hypothetical protein
MAGIDLTTVSWLMEHKTLAMTLRYSHLAPNHLDNAVNLLAAGLRGVTSQPVHSQNEKEAKLAA